MLNNLKKWAARLGLVVTAAVSGAGCQYIEPMGQAVHAEADGVLTQTEENDILDLLEATDRGERKLIEYVDEDSYITDFTGGPLQNLVNEADEYISQEMEKNGFPRKRFGNGLNMFLAPSRQYLIENENMAEYAGAFYRSSNNTIYIPLKTGPIGFEVDLGYGNFVPYFHHELGHHLREGAYEMASMGNEIYSNLKMYDFNKKLGSPLVSIGLFLLPEEEWKDIYANALSIYTIGSLDFLVQVNWKRDSNGNIVEADGNLEAAMNRILTDPQLHLEKKVKEVSSRYSNFREAQTAELNNMVSKQGFRESFRNLDDREFEEFAAMLKLGNYATIYFMSRFEEAGVNVEARDAFLQLSEEFLGKYGQNPYFKARVVRNLTGYHTYYLEGYIQAFAGTNDDAYVWAEYELAKKIIAYNKDYPCEYSFYECPIMVSGPSLGHTTAYYAALIHSYRLLHNNWASKDELIALGEEYVNKFYPDADYRFEEKSWYTSKFLPTIAYNTGQLWLKKYYQDAQNYDELLDYCNQAKNWFKITQAASCDVVQDEKERERCISIIGADFYALAQDALNNLFCNQN